MATSYELIYKKFLNLIDDYEIGMLAKSNPIELNEVLEQYLDDARGLHFPQCKKNLDNVRNPSGIAGLGEFAEDLTNREQSILALGMQLSWLNGKLYNADLMRKDIGDRDYKAVQGDKYLKELKGLKAELRDEVREYAREYTYQNFNIDSW